MAGDRSGSPRGLELRTARVDGGRRRTRGRGGAHARPVRTRPNREHLPPDRAACQPTRSACCVRLDAAGVRGLLDLLGAEAADVPARAARAVAPPGRAMGRAREPLPPDWSDVYAEVELDSSDFLQRGALLLSPSTRLATEGRTTLRFRVARSVGYGAAPSMARRSSSGSTANASPAACGSSEFSRRRAMSPRRARSGASRGRSV